MLPGNRHLQPSEESQFQTKLRFPLLLCPNNRILYNGIPCLSASLSNGTGRLDPSRGCRGSPHENNTLDLQRQLAQPVAITASLPKTGTGGRRNAMAMCAPHISRGTRSETTFTVLSQSDSHSDAIVHGSGRDNYGVTGIRHFWVNH